MGKRQKYIVALVALGTIASGAVFMITATRAFFYSSDSKEVAAPNLEQSAPIRKAPVAARPERLIIPSLQIDALVQQVGVKANGAMATPKNFTDVGWYKYGTIPGQEGSAVIAGHVDNGLALPGVFKHLSDLKIGDELYVQTIDGSKLRFVVQDIQKYSHTAVPTEEVFNARGAAHLNLITCDGTWIPTDKTYDKRLIVYSTLAADE